MALGMNRPQWDENGILIEQRDLTARVKDAVEQAGGWRIVQDKGRHTIGALKLSNGCWLRKDVWWPVPFSDREIDEVIAITFPLMVYDLRSKGLPRGATDSFVGSDGVGPHGYLYAIPQPGQPDWTPCRLTFGDDEEAAVEFGMSLKIPTEEEWAPIRAMMEQAEIDRIKAESDARIAAQEAG